MNSRDLEIEARRLERTVNDRLRSCWPTWSHLVRRRMRDALIASVLQGRWEYMVLETLGQPDQIKITQWLGEIDL